MKYNQQTRDLYYAISEAFRIAQDDVESVSHELAHGILLFGRPKLDLSHLVTKRLDRLSPLTANRWEMAAIALQWASLKAVGLRPDYWETALEGYHNIRGYDSVLWCSVEAIMATAKAWPVNEQHVTQFVTLVRQFETWV